MKRNILRTRQIALVLNILFIEIIYCQAKQINTVSVVQKHILPIAVQFPALFFHSSLKYPDIVFFYSDSSQIRILKNNRDGHYFDSKVIARTSEVTSLSVGNINNDDLDDVVVVHRDQNLIELLLSKRSDSSYSSSKYHVNYYPERVIIADITNDRIPDIISYGKLSTGICVLQGKGNGKFLAKKTLFENIPVGDFSVVSLNADRIADAAVNNWLTNETILYLGFGKLKFSEQTILSFDQDSVSTLFGDFNNDALADIAVSSSQNKTIQILLGDGLGNFTTTQTITTIVDPEKISMRSFNGLNTHDIILNSSSSNLFSILVNDGKGTFYDEIVFGKKQNLFAPMVGDINADGFADIIDIQQDSLQYLTLWNSQTKLNSVLKDISFAVGSKPTCLSVIDMNNDGLDDIVAGNTESSTISFLLSNASSFNSQLSVEVPEKPSSVSFYSKSDSTVTFYTTHQETPQLSVFTIKKGRDSSFSVLGDIEQFSIPLPEKPMTVLPDISYRQKGISLYAFMSTSTNAIVFYQQVKGTRFLTKNLVPNIQSKIIYATISDLNNDGNTDLLYIYNDEKQKNCILGISMNDSIGEFKGKIFRYTVSDSLIRKAYIYIEDVNSDQIKDCIVHTSPGNAIWLSLGSKENIFENFVKIAERINIRIPEHIHNFDYDNDGISDILYLDREYSELFMLRGKGNGKYSARKKILVLPKESFFRAGDFNGDNMTDIVYTNPTENTVSIFYGSK